jgi:hypothetical protein
MAYATLRECSVGQPRYRVEVYYDGEGECYFRDGWSKFFADYGVHIGVAPCLIKRQNSCVSVPFPGSVDSTTVQNK